MNRSGRLHACTAVLRDASMCRLVIANLAFMLIETILWIGSLVYAYEQGGAAEVGYAAFALLVPAVIIAPLASFCGDRFHRVHVLVVSYLAIALASAAVALALANDSPSLVVYLAAGVAASAVTFPRPATGALMPCVTESGDQLTAVNVCTGISQSIGAAVGPATAAVLLAWGDVSWLFGAGAALGVLAALLVVGVRTVVDVVPYEQHITIGDVRHETMAGIHLLKRQRQPRLVVGLLGLGGFMIGVLDVSGVVIAIDVLHKSDGFAGVLGAAMGVGSIAGAGLGVLLIGRRRLAPVLVAAAGLQCLPLLGFSLTTSVVPALVIFLACGAGLSMTEVGGQTLLQGITPDDVMARVFGCLEGFRMACIAVGSLVCSLLVDSIGSGRGLAVVAVGAAGFALLGSPGLLAIDRSRPLPNPELIRLLRGTPIFGPLPAYTLEQLMINLRRFEPGEGVSIVEQGASGSALYVVAAGCADVRRDGVLVHTCQPGDYFGEVALLLDQPRNATVVAHAGSVLYELDRDVFLEAVTGHPRIFDRARSQAMKRA